MSIDPHFERAVLAEFRLRELRTRRRDASHGAQPLAQKPAVELFDAASALRRSALRRARSLSNAPGTLTALRLLPDPGFAG